MHDIYEMTSDKENGVVGVVSTGDGNYSNTSTSVTSNLSHHHPYSMGSHAQDTIGVVRTVQVVVESVDIQQHRTTPHGDTSSSKSSLALL
jgi:hypothetical protein